MSTIIMAACWPLQGMSAAQKSVLVSLADNANDEGVCWPSVAKISQRTCLSERAVQNALRWLECAGLLQARDRNGRSNVYTVTPAAYAPPQEMHPAPNAPTPARDAPPPPQDVHPTPAAGAPRTINEPSIEPPLNLQMGRVESVDLFDEAWKAYPKRSGGNSKPDARKAWAARLKAGIEPEDIVAGVHRYAAFCRAEGKTGTAFVKQAATFFGPGEHWTEEWRITEAPADQQRTSPNKHSAAAATIFEGVWDA